VPNRPVLFHVSTRDQAMFGSPSERSLAGSVGVREIPGLNWEASHNRHVY
jgi:hypothetical protein